VAPVVIPNYILQDTLKQQRQLLERLARVSLRQAQHRILNQIQREMLVPNREYRLLERPAFDFRQETRELFFCSQWTMPYL